MSFPGYQLGLSALIENDLSSYELFVSLPEDVKKQLAASDVNSFDELQAKASALTKSQILS